MDPNRKTVEVSARSVDEAVAQALQQLGLSRDDVEIEVVRQGSRGLLGLLSENAVVRVSAKAAPIRVESVPVAVAVSERADTKSAEEEPLSAEDLAGQARLGAELLQGLLERIGVQARVDEEPGQQDPESEDRPPTILNIVGDDLGLLIGRRGETLRDLQFLTCLMVSRKTQRWPELMVDVEHYRARREKSLQELAQRMADRVRATGQSMPLEPMPPNERRIVHLALKDDPDVRTESYGEDEDRKVVVIPKS
jgi:spoIIIJ-associated protein